MKIPTKTHLLKELDSVGHARRVQRLALLGRDAAGTAPLNQLLDELQSGDSYEQMLGLFASIAARDEARILTALQSDSVWLRNHAAAAAGWAVADDEALAAVVLKAAPDTRQRLLKTISRRRRTALAERLLPQIRTEFGAKLAVSVLSACTATSVEKFLAEEGHAVKHWYRLANLYPDVILSDIQQQFETAPRRTHHSLWSHFDSAWKPLALHRSEKVLTLV